MAFFTRLLKIFVVLGLIVAIAIPLRYGSTDYRYLRARVGHTLLTSLYSFVPDPDRPNLTAEYRAFEALLRIRPLIADHLYADPSQAIKLLRLHVRSNNVSPQPSECQVDKDVFVHDQHSMDGYWINHPPRNFQRKTDKLLLYFHGGGYVFGDIERK